LENLLLSVAFHVKVFCTDDIDFEKIALLNPGLILFDFDSTQPNHLAIFRELKKIPCLTETPVLFVSDTCDDQTTEFAFQLGVADLICLPFQKNEVLYRIKKHFTRPVNQSQEIEQSRNITGKKQAEKALLDSEDRFRRIVESSPIGKQLYQLNEKDELILLRANPATDAILGLDQSLLVGKTIQQAFPNLVETEIPDLLRLIAKGELDTQHFEIKNPSDQIDQHFEVTAFRIAENTLSVDFIDITQRKLSEQKLQGSEEKYRLLFENNPQAMWIYDSKTLAIMDVNEATVSQYGFTKEEFLSMTLLDLLPGKVTGELQAYLPLISMGLNKSGIWPHQKKTGELIDLEIISHQIEYQGRSARLVSSLDVTERVKAETALLESEERFRTTLYSIGDAVITTDALGKVQMMNTIAEQLTGWLQVEAEGRTLEEVFPIINEDTRRPVEAPVRKVIREGATVGLANHTVLIGKSGVECPIADSAAPIRNEKGETVGVVLVFRDQTRERDAERTLQESELFFRESQKAAKIGSFKLDISTGFWTSSEVLDEIFGIDQDFIRNIGNWENLIHPDDLPMMDHHLNIEVIQEKQPFNKEYRIFRKSDGDLRWLHDMGQLIFDKSGAVMFVIGTTQDITERKEAEKAIQSKNSRLNAIIQAMPDLIFISDREGNYLEFFNPKANGMLYPPEKLIGVNVKEVFDQATARFQIEKIQECIDQQKLVNYEYNAEKDGEPMYFEGRIVPLGENRVLRFVRDITESKILQQEQFRLINSIESSLNEISVFDPETLRFSYVNRCGLSNLGYSLDEMKNLTPVDITVGYDWNTFGELIEPLISGQKQKLVFETVHKRKDGTTYPVEVYLQLHFQDKGKIFFAVINDITYRKLAEASLRESEEMFRKLAESSPMLIGIFQDDRWIYTNPATEKLGGYNEEEYKQMFVWDFVAPEFQSIVKEYTSLQSEGLPPEKGYEFKIIRKNGESRWLYLRGSRISYKGRPAGLISGLDMTDKKAMEDELRQSEERFRRAITEAPFPIMLHADNEEVLAISRGWTEISGYDAEEISTTSE
jgi:PAS domain S-box-containing protein